MSDEQSIEEEIARTLEDLFDGDCGQGVGQDAAAVLMPLLNRVRAEAAARALREAANETKREAPGEPYAGATFTAHAAWLNARADRIERGETA